MQLINRSKSCILLVSLVFLPFTSSIGKSRPGKQSDALHQKIERVCAGFEGDAGIYIRNLVTGAEVAIHADSLFPTASMIKLPILLALFEKIENRALAYNEALTYTDSLLYPGTDILGSFKNGEKITLGKVVMLMISTSDNTASLWCQSLAGGGMQINQFLARNGFSKTRLNSRTKGRQSAWQQYGWGQTTAREMAEMLVKIRQHKILTPGACDEAYRVLSNIYWHGEALSQIPPWVQAASKQGAISQSRSEVVLVNAPSGDYVFCVITNNQRDTSWRYDNAGFVLIRRISQILWQHFEPQLTWHPAAGSADWAK